MVGKRTERLEAGEAIRRAGDSPGTWRRAAVQPAERAAIARHAAIDAGAAVRPAADAVGFAAASASRRPGADPATPVAGSGSGPDGLRLLAPVVTSVPVFDPDRDPQRLRVADPAPLRPWNFAERGSDLRGEDAGRGAPAPGGSELLKRLNGQSTAWAKHDLSRPMKQLTPTEWSRMRDRMTSLSLPNRGPAVHAGWVAWLIGHPGASWFYPMADNIHFGSRADADAFRHWMMATAD